MGDELVEPVADVLILLDVDTADAERGEEVVEGLAACKTLDELAEAADGVDEVLVGGGVVDEGVERGGLVDVTSSVEGTMDPFLDDVEDGGDGVVVRLVALSAVAELHTR